MRGIEDGVECGEEIWACPIRLRAPPYSSLLTERRCCWVQKWAPTRYASLACTRRGFVRLAYPPWREHKHTDIVNQLIKYLSYPERTVVHPEICIACLSNVVYRPIEVLLIYGEGGREHKLHQHQLHYASLHIQITVGLVGSGFWLRSSSSSRP